MMTETTDALTVGTELETIDGEPVEITNERGDGRLCLNFPERERDGHAFTEWRTPEALAGAVSDGVFSVVGEDSEESDDHMDGEFHGPVRCPDCSAFMHTGYDGQGFPVARCSRDACHGVKDVDELMADGEWTED